MISLTLGSGRISEGVSFYVQGCHALFNSKLHLDLYFYPGSNTKISETLREMRRRLFWLYYEYGVHLGYILVNIIQFKSKGQTTFNRRRDLSWGFAK